MLPGASYRISVSVFRSCGPSHWNSSSYAKISEKSELPPALSAARISCPPGVSRSVAAVENSTGKSIEELATQVTQEIGLAKKPGNGI